MAVKSSMVLLEKAHLERKLQELEKDKDNLTQRLLEAQDELKLESDSHEAEVEEWNMQYQNWRKQLEESETKALESEIKSEEFEGKLKEHALYRKKVEEREKEREREYTRELAQIKDEKYDAELKLASNKRSEGANNSEQEFKNALYLAHDHRRDHLQNVSESLEEATKRLKHFVGQDEKVKTLSERLSAAENLCRKLLLRSCKEQEELRHLRQSVQQAENRRGTVMKQTRNKASISVPIQPRSMKRTSAVVPISTPAVRISETHVNDPDSIDNFF